jgi:hypothetical protein
MYFKKKEKKSHLLAQVGPPNICVFTLLTYNVKILS